MLARIAFLVIFGAALAAVEAADAAVALSTKCTAKAPVREFDLVTGEWDTVPKDREGKPAAYTDRGQPRAANSKLERYTFDPGVLVVKKGDCVVLRIHAVKGSHHNVTIEGTEVGSEGAPIIGEGGAVAAVRAVARPNPNNYEDPPALKDGEFVRGEQVSLAFQANQPGTYRMICEVHTFIGSKGEFRGYDDKGKPVAGPMVAYVVVLP